MNSAGVRVVTTYQTGRNRGNRCRAGRYSRRHDGKRDRAITASKYAGASICPSAGRLDECGLQFSVEVEPDFRDPLVSNLAEERGRFVVFEYDLPTFGLKERDAKRRIERRA